MRARWVPPFPCEALMRVLVGLLIGMLISAPAAAQSPSVFLGYESAHPDFENVHVFAGTMPGWHIGTSIPLTGGVDLLGEADGVYGDSFGLGIVIRRIGTARPWVYSFDGGVRYSWLRNERVSPFIQGTFGVAHGQVGTMGVDFIGVTTDTKFESGIGAGASIHVTRSFGVQGDVSYRRSRLFDQVLNRVQLGVGAVWWF